MVCLMMAKLNAFLKADGDVLRCTEVSLQETPTNTVSFSGNPEEMIPASRAPEACWWNRADMSISD